MARVAKPLLMVAAAGLMSLGGVWLIGNGTAANGRTASLSNQSFHGFKLGSYKLERMALAKTTLFNVHENYVDMERVDYEELFEASLSGIERTLPTALFRRVPGSSMLHIQVGDHRSVIELPEMNGVEPLVSTLQEIAVLLTAHASPSDIAAEDPENPWASVEYALVNSILGELDPHSRLLPPEDSREMDVENSGEFGGLGITIVERGGVLTVDYPLPDTPAFEAGIKSGDRIVRIDGESTINMGLEDAVSLLRGRIGTKVTVVIERDEATEPIEVEITRARIKINPVEGMLLDGDIGIVSVKSFHANVAPDLELTLKRMADEAKSGRLKGVILDLRGNPGGYLHQAVRVVDLFLEEGAIVKTKSRGRVDDEEMAKAARTQPQYPLAVLVNSGSASASEIVAGALRAHNRAIVIGERTFGKGSVQNLEGLSDGSKLKLTVAQYFTGPVDQVIQGVGVPADIELVSVVLAANKDGTAKSSLYHWRDRVRREADYDNHLDSQAVQAKPAMHSIRYLRPSNLRRTDSTLNHLARDPEVMFARDVLAAAKGAKRTAEILARVAGPVKRLRDAGDADITAAFEALGIDWTAGAATPEASLDVRLDLGPDAVLKAGEEERIWLEVTNKGNAPIYRLTGTSASEAEVLDGREYFFGRLDPGETLKWSQVVSLGEGYPTEDAPVEFSFMDGSDEVIHEWDIQLPVRGHALPSLNFTYALDDAKGDGDGVPEAGETIDLAITVTNVGEGATQEAFARLKNGSGKGLDLVVGTLEVGEMRTAEGEPCPVVRGGTENGRVVLPTVTDTDAEVDADISGPPRYASGCARSLKPGEAWTGSFQVKLAESDSPWRVDLSVGDAEAYDYAAVMRSSFYDTFTDKVTIELGEKVEAEYSPPKVEVTTPLPSKTSVSAMPVSGLASDEALAHVTVWLNDKKVGLSQGDGLQAVPFHADLDLVAGTNVITVIATDQSGMKSTWSGVTFLESPPGPDDEE